MLSKSLLKLGQYLRGSIGIYKFTKQITKSVNQYEKNIRPKSVLKLDQYLKGSVGTYKITKQMTENVYCAVNQHEKNVIVKNLDGHWLLRNERDILKRFQERTSALRPLLDEIVEPAEPLTIVLKYLDDDLIEVSKKRRLTRLEIKYVAKNILNALSVLHKDGYVHTDIKPDNILVNYKNEENRFSEVELADCGGTVSIDSECAKNGIVVGTGLFRAPEVHLGIPWDTAADIWSFGVTIISLIWGFNFDPFLPDISFDDEMFELKIVMNQFRFFGPFPISFLDLVTNDYQRQVMLDIISAVPPEEMIPFQMLGEREISPEDKAFVLKIMKFDPRDRPTAQELLQDEWFTECSTRTVGWYSKKEWHNMQQYNSI